MITWTEGVRVSGSGSGRVSNFFFSAIKWGPRVGYPLVSTAYLNILYVLNVYLIFMGVPEVLIPLDAYVVHPGFFIQNRGDNIRSAPIH